MIAKILGAALICVTLAGAPAFAQTTNSNASNKGGGDDGSACTTTDGAAGTMQGGNCMAK